MKAVGVDITVVMKNDLDEEFNATLKDVLHIPGAPRCLLSASKILDAGIYLEATKEQFLLLLEDSTSVVAERRNDLFIIDSRVKHLPDSRWR